MNLVPDWAPNIHPLLVHFPLALLIAAGAVDIMSLAFRRNKPLRESATLLYVLGTMAAAAAYATGRAAAQAVWLPGMAQPVRFFAIVTVVRLVLLRPSRRDPGPTTIAAFALAGLVGIGLLLETGDRGGRLVYQHGVGTTRGYER
jgi:uncharacterized membrane protein